MKWNVIIEGKTYFSLSLVGERSTLYNFGKLPKTGLFKKIKDYVKENRELFLRKSPISAKIADETVWFKKAREN